MVNIQSLTFQGCVGQPEEKLGSLPVQWAFLGISDILEKKKHSNYTFLLLIYYNNII